MSKEYDVEVRSWDDKVQKAIYECDKEVFKLIDEGVNETDQFMVVNYQFSDDITAAGMLYLPEVGSRGSVPFFPDSSSGSLSKFAKNFTLFPFGMVTKGYADVYWSALDKIILKGVLKSGTVLGTRNILEEPRSFAFRGVWRACAGSRTLSLLPSIKDVEKYKRLRSQFNVEADIPKNFSGHFDIFGELFRASNESWSTQVIFFSDKVTQAVRDEPRFSSLKNFVANRILKATCFDRNQSCFDFIWDEFIRFSEEKGVKEKSYIYDIAKHLTLVAIGEEFAFSPVSSNEVGPIDYLSDVFVNSYRLRYFPSFIHARPLDISKAKDTLYYSLQYPIHVNPFPMKRAASSGIDDLRSVKVIHDRFFDFITSDGGELSRESVVSDIVDSIEFDYFHTVQDSLKKVSRSMTIAEQDPRFLRKVVNSDQPFCDSSAFFKCCVKIDKK